MCSVMSVRDLRFSYGGFQVLKDVSFDLKEGEMLFVVGPNGSGKSTLLKCLIGILKCDGEVEVFGRKLSEMRRGEIARLISYVPQRAEISQLTVFDTIMLGRKPHATGFMESFGKRDVRIAEDVIELMGLEKLAFRRLSELSGGELQKVMIARALAQEPRILLLDEPTANLDLRNQVRVMNTLRRVISRKGISAVITMHDLNTTAAYADRVVMMEKGRIVACGGVEVLSAENIMKVYGVEVSIVKFNGKRIVVPSITPE